MKRGHQRGGGAEEWIDCWQVSHQWSGVIADFTEGGLTGIYGHAMILAGDEELLGIWL